MNTRTWLAIWVGVILLVVVPWRAIEAHAYWERVAWIPFVSPPVEFDDAFGNVLFYVPYGILAGREAARAKRPILLVTSSGMLLALATEFTQIFSRSRFPSMTDAVCNVLGAFIGAVWALRRHPRR